MTKSKIKENILIRQMFLSKSQQKAHTLTPMMQKILLIFFFKKLPQMMRSQSYTKA